MPARATTVRFVDVDGARALLDGGATVVDARGVRALRRGHLPGAVPLEWKRLRDGWGRTGRVTDDDEELSHALGERGVEAARTVLVYGDGRDGSGAEGRVAWMLALVGVDDVALLDGGVAAWIGAGLPLARGPGAAPRRSSFRARRDERLRASVADVQRAQGRADARILDVRSDAEWNGATPHLEPRGGRIPGARHLEWTKLLDGDGRLLPADAIDALLAAVGIAREHELIVYCTGGVRSAFVWAALIARGWPRVRMYDGSFLEWSKRRALPVEAERRPLPRRLLRWAALTAAVGATALGVARARRLRRAR